MAVFIAVFLTLTIDNKKYRAFRIWCQIFLDAEFHKNSESEDPVVIGGHTAEQSQIYRTRQTISASIAENDPDVR